MVRDRLLGPIIAPFSLLLCALFKCFVFFPRDSGSAAEDFQARSDVLGFSPLLPVPCSCLQRRRRPLGSGSRQEQPPVPRTPEQRAVGWTASTSTLQRDMGQFGLPLERLRAVPGRMNHVSQEEIKLSELSKSNFRDKCSPCGLHVEPVLLLSLTQPGLVMAALKNRFDFSWGS